MVKVSPFYLKRYLHSFLTHSYSLLLKSKAVQCNNTKNLFTQKLHQYNILNIALYSKYKKLMIYMTVFCSTISFPWKQLIPSRSFLHQNVNMCIFMLHIHIPFTFLYLNKLQTTIVRPWIAVLPSFMMSKTKKSTCMEDDLFLCALF